MDGIDCVVGRMKSRIHVIEGRIGEVVRWRDRFMAIIALAVSLYTWEQVSKRTSGSPFSKSKGRIESVAFHPNKPLFFVATQRQ